MFTINIGRYEEYRTISSQNKLPIVKSPNVKTKYLGGMKTLLDLRSELKDGKHFCFELSQPVWVVRSGVRTDTSADIFDVNLPHKSSQ